MHIQSPREPLGPLLSTEQEIRGAAHALRDGDGPVAIDTERAGAFRFNDRAFLIQLRRRGVGTILIDPTGSPNAIAELARVLNDIPWILHAAHTDLPCLFSLGMRPVTLHDTQIAGRILGHRQLGLGAMLEEILGISIAKDKGREDWSRRPLPRAMLTYAALDVEFLLELHGACQQQITDLGRLEWYRQDCAHELHTAQPLQEPAFEQLRGVHSLRTPRSLAIAEEVFTARTDWCRHNDRSPEVTMPARLIVSLASTPQRAVRHASTVSLPSGLRAQVIAAVHHALALPDATLPGPLPRPPRLHPDHKQWAEDYPIAYRASHIIADSLAEVADDLAVRSDTIAVMRQVRAAAWEVSQVEGLSRPALADSQWEHDTLEETTPGDDPIGRVEEAFGSAMRRAGARDWQIDLLGDYCLGPLIDSLGDC